jgi:hypothetical protein
MADQLATPEDLAALLQLDLDRATAELLIECATAVVQRAADGQRILEVVDDEVTLDVSGQIDSSWLVLPQWPATAVSAVEIDGSVITGYTLQAGRNRIYRSVGWGSESFDYDPAAPSTVTVTYTHGYPAGHHKLQLARSAVLSLAAQGYSNPTGATREQIDDYTVQYAEMGARMDASPYLVRALRQQYSLAAFSVRVGY